MESYRLSALYLTEHAYLNYPTQLINFGGQFIYEINSVEAGMLKIKRSENLNWQKDFFNITNSDIKISNVSAMVGQNGVGKSTILNCIRQHFIESPTALASNHSILLFEKGTDLFFSCLDKQARVILKGEKTDVKLGELDVGKVQTIYYSPHFDLRFNPNFDEIDYHDISLDRFIELDLEDLSSRGTNENGVDFPVKQELLFKNSKRQIQFFNSSLVLERKIFKDLIDFPDHGDATFITRDTRVAENLRNVPADFLGPLEELKKQIENDLNNWTQIRVRNDKNRVTNQAEINRYLMQRYLVKNLLSVIVKQMEISNDYRSAGDFDQKYFDEYKGTDSLSGLLAFLTSCKIRFSNRSVKPFDVKLIEQLFKLIYSITNRIKDERLIKPNFFKCSGEEAIKVLELQNEIVFNISTYYIRPNAKRSQDYSRLNYLVSSFLYYSPAERQLSSGENAFLNLFSKLYYFLTEKLTSGVNPKLIVQSYIILLDEADLGFHPLWKKKYLYTLISTLPDFFETLGHKVNLQIIFTTHDPLTLSDLPNSNVVYLRLIGEVIKVLKTFERRPTFAANITDLLADSFFINDALIGDFAQHKINSIISWLNSDSKENSDEYMTTIKMIDEPIVRQKLAEMFDYKMNTRIEVAIIDKQLEELNLRKRRLENDRNSDNIS